MVSQVKSLTQVSQVRHINFTQSIAEGFQFLILDLNVDKDEESLISFRINSLAFGPLYRIVSRPLLTDFALKIIQSFLPDREKFRAQVVLNFLHFYRQFLQVPLMDCK